MCYVLNIAVADLGEGPIYIWLGRVTKKRTSFVWRMVQSGPVVCILAECIGNLLFTPLNLPEQTVELVNHIKRQVLLTRRFCKGRDSIFLF